MPFLRPRIHPFLPSLALGLLPDPNRRDEDQLLYVLVVLHRVVADEVAAEGVTGEDELFQLHDLAPRFDVLDEVVDRLLGREVVVVKVVRSAATAHADDIEDDKLEVVGQAFEGLVEEGA